MNIAFVTDSTHSNFAEDDRILVNFLTDHNHCITPSVWDDQSVDWPSFHSIIFRSPWDYFLKFDTFNHWLNQLERLNLNVFNPIQVIQWNKNKNYLLRFRDLGVAMPEFHYCQRGTSHIIEKVLKQYQWEKAVIKPSISGGAYKTWVTDLMDASLHQLEFNALVSEQGVIVQKFSDEIISSGELSLIYFNKKFSHAVCKKSMEGEFRVQAQYGGRHSPYSPDHNLFIQMDYILALIPEPLLYARIDGYLDEYGKFYLMELELLEPVLFFDSDLQACHRFYLALKEMML
ncbi:MAG: hypothetical protein ABIR66_04505 [Saprospiraceae bacterium]